MSTSTPDEIIIPDSPFQDPWRAGAWQAGWSHLLGRLAAASEAAEPAPQCGLGWEKCLQGCQAHRDWWARRRQTEQRIFAAVRERATTAIEAAVSSEPADTYYGTQSCWEAAARRAAGRVRLP